MSPDVPRTRHGGLVLHVPDARRRPEDGDVGVAVAVVVAGNGRSPATPPNCANGGWSLHVPAPPLRAVGDDVGIAVTVEVGDGRSVPRRKAIGGRVRGCRVRATMLCAARAAVRPRREVVVVPFEVCGEGALTEFVEPSITVRVKGAASVVLPTVSCETRRDSTANVSVDRLRVEVERRACRCPVRVGRGEPRARVRRVLVVGRGERAARHAAQGLDECVWQFDGQWCRTSVHESAERRQRALLRVRRRCPVNAIESPTFQVSRGDRASIVAVGRACCRRDRDARSRRRAACVGDLEPRGVGPAAACR